MARKAKCLYCTKEVELKEGYKVSIKGRNRYFCNSVEYDIYVLNEENKLAEKAKKDELITWIVEEFYDYEKGMVFPITLTKRINKLFEFYPIEIIREVFEKQSELFYWAKDNRGFTNEFNKTCYYMKVVEDSINDVYLEYKRKQKQEKKIENKINNEIEFMIDEIPNRNKPKATSGNGGISRFLTDDDF